MKKAQFFLLVSDKVCKYSKKREKEDIEEKGRMEEKEEKEEEKEILQKSSVTEVLAKVGHISEWREGNAHWTVFCECSSPLVSSVLFIFKPSTTFDKPIRITKGPNFSVERVHYFPLFYFQYWSL